MIRIKTENIDVILTKEEQRVLELALLTFEVPETLTRGGKPLNLAKEYSTIAKFLYHAVKRKEKETELDIPHDFDQGKK